MWKTLATRKIQAIRRGRKTFAHRFFLLTQPGKNRLASFAKTINTGIVHRWRTEVKKSQNILLRLGLAIFGVLFLVWLTLPDVGSRPPARVSQCKNNLKQIGLALHNYHEVYGSFPPQFTVDANGKPLHSWRLLILPYLDQQGIYRQFDLSSPWTSPANVDLSNEPLSVYWCPYRKDEQIGSFTNYVGVAGENTVWQGPRATSKADLGRDLGSVVMVVEVADCHVPWAKPQDIPFETATGGINSSHSHAPSSHHHQGVNILFADGTVKILKAGLDDDRLKKWLVVPD